jgi:hypothetical protein
MFDPGSAVFVQEIAKVVGIELAIHMSRVWKQHLQFVGQSWLALDQPSHFVHTSNREEATLVQVGDAKLSASSPRWRGNHIHDKGYDCFFRSRTRPSVLSI